MRSWCGATRAGEGVGNGKAFDLLGDQSQDEKMMDALAELDRCILRTLFIDQRCQYWIDPHILRGM